MSHEGPDWLTAELLTEILGRKVKSVSCSPAAPPGTNYGSLVTRVKVHIEDRQEPLSLIVKSELHNCTLKSNFDLPETIEHDFYYKFIPLAGRIADTSFAPRAFPSPRSKSVVLEDLKSRGFEMVDRDRLFNFEECRLYMVAAAKLHALSLAVHEKHPELVESLGGEKMFSNDLKSAAVWKTMLEGGVERLLQAIGETEKFSRSKRIIAGVRDRLWEMIVEAHKRVEGVNTINQGDPWTTNMMFRYDENRIVREIKLFDFQCLRFASPLNDLVWFIWTSADHDVRQSRLLELYKVYLRNFNENLEDFGCAMRLTESNFMNGIRKLSPMTLITVAAFLPVILLHRVPFDVEKLNKNYVEFYNQYYDANFCTHHLTQSMEEMEQVGVFDYLEHHLTE